MAQTFIPAVIRNQNFNNALIIVPIPQSPIKDVTIGGVTATGAGNLLGAGIFKLQGVALNACLIGNSSPVGPGSGTSIDPPVIYTFCNATSPYGRDYLNLNLKMVRANDYSFNIQVVLNGNAVNLTGGTLRMSVKWQPTDSDANELFSVSSPSNGIVFINPSAGTATVTIASSLTNITAVPYHTVNLPYDIQYTDVNNKRYTVMLGTLTIVPNISQTSP